jgi:dodecin
MPAPGCGRRTGSAIASADGASRRTWPTRLEAAPDGAGPSSEVRASERAAVQVVAASPVGSRERRNGPIVVAPAGWVRAALQREAAMAVASVSKVTASSTQSFDAAVREGLERASKTLRGITGLHVVEQKASVNDGKIAEFRVTMEVTFILEG